MSTVLSVLTAFALDWFVNEAKADIAFEMARFFRLALMDLFQLRLVYNPSHMIIGHRQLFFHEITDILLLFDDVEVARYLHTGYL